MPKRRTITVELAANATEEEYAHLANAIWVVASLSSKFRAVARDDHADPSYLDAWWDEDSQVRWRK